MQRVANLSELRAKEAQAAAIEVAELSHVYLGREGKVPALEDISLDVGAGRFVVIVGPSGCGKTSLLMMMAGLRRPTSGTIRGGRSMCPIPIGSASCSRRRAFFRGSPRSRISSFRSASVAPPAWSGAGALTPCSTLSASQGLARDILTSYRAG